MCGGDAVVIQNDLRFSIFCLLTVLVDDDVEVTGMYCEDQDEE